jgi:hypothetical protein
MDANYVGIGSGVNVSTSQNELIAEGHAPMFLPGVARAETSYHLRPKSTQPKLRLTKKEGLVSTPPTNEPFSGAAEMTISTERQSQDMKMLLIDVRA